MNERYVREWLGAMVMGRIVEYDPGGGDLQSAPGARRGLPGRHRPTTPAATAQLIPLMGHGRGPDRGGFRQGGGVPYSAYPRFHEVMAEDSGRRWSPRCSTRSCRWYPA